MKLTKNIHLKLPSYDRKKQEYKWSLLKVKNTKRKGLGLFAKTHIQAGTCFPYFGKIYNQTQYRKLLKQNKLMNRWDYLLENENQKSYTDAHPQWDYENLYIIGKVNEPDSNESSNCWFLTIRKTPFVFLLILEDINPGEELLVYYGPHFQRNYILGNIKFPPLHFPRENGVLDKNMLKKMENFENKIKTGN